MGSHARWRVSRSGWQCFLKVALVAAGAVSCGESTAPHLPGVHLSGDNVLADTIGARVRLAVVVLDTTSRPAADVVVRFEALPAGPSSDPTLLAVSKVDTQPAVRFVADTTDSRGHAEISVRLGYTPGPASLVVAVPVFGFIDTMTYQVQPGQLAGVDAQPADTAIYVGAGFTLRAHAVDRVGNALPNALSYSASRGGVTVDAGSGALTASAIGRAALVARVGNLADTAYVSVVPRAWVVSEPFDPGNGGPIGMDLIQLDGSGDQRIGPGIENVFATHGFSWSPDGQYIAIASGYGVNLLKPGGTWQPIVHLTGALVKSTRFSPDGQWIYFAEGAGSAAQPQGMYRVRPDGTGLEHIGPAGPNYYPSPSHDGASVVYLSYAAPCGVDPCIRVLDITTGMPRTYAGASYLARGVLAAWSPVEDLIAYGSGANLMLVHSDGSGARVLATDISDVKWMDWSPDGQWLIVAAQGMLLFEVSTGLRLPIPPLTAFGPTAWRP